VSDVIAVVGDNVAAIFMIMIVAVAIVIVVDMVIVITAHANSTAITIVYFIVTTVGRITEINYIGPIA
jgi:hypothetical protein